MRALITRLGLVAAAAVAAVTLFLLFTAPPPALDFDLALPDTVAIGAYHVHSDRSDGAGSVEQIAQAAASAGLDFVILTDHGDGTRTPDAPAYISGVLMIDAVEIGTRGGHVVALGLSAPSAYPLGGRPDDVVEDVHRQGGFAVLAHPDSPNGGLRWRGGRGGYDGLEWLNADSEWRNESTAQLLATLVRSFVRPAEAIAAVFERPTRTLQRWDQAARERDVVGLAAVDAHGGLSLGDDGDGRSRRTLVSVPSYSAMFRTVTQAVVLDVPLDGSPEGDALLVVDAIRRGRTFSQIRALGGPTSLEFTATAADGERVPMGTRLAPGAGEVEFNASVPGAPGVQVALLHDGRTVAGGQGSVTWRSPEPGSYRVEVGFPGAVVPWIVSNPIYVGEVQATAEQPLTPGPTVPFVPSSRWTIEADGTSEGEVLVGDDGLEFVYRLGGGPPAGQYAALVAAVDGDQGFDRLVFRASASSPMRLSVQLRLPGGRDGLRWRRSVFVDTTPRDIVVRLDELEPAGGTSSQQPLVAPVQSVLFVVDTVNTLPGSAGQVTVSDVRFGLGDLNR